MYCEVCLFDLPYHVDRPFDYECPEGLKPGSLVKVPFGKNNSLRYGIVTAIKEVADAAEKIKPVHTVCYDRPVLNDEMLGLCLFLKDYTLCTFGECARTVLPPGTLSDRQAIKYKKRIRLAVSESEARALLEARGRAGIRAEGQRLALSRLIELTEIDCELLMAEVGVSAANIKALVDKKIASVSEEEIYRNPYAAYARERDTGEIVLTRAQSLAYATVEKLYEADEARAGLLFGVTGSGKTKVIMKAIDRVIADGKAAIMLVPEIALTPQTVSIFCKRYGERVAVIHSSLSQGERSDAARRIERGEVDLVIGTRSAIFAPLKNIGIIVIDEEHEHTYKSESDPKYHAREVAAYRAGKHNALLLLASATPSLESFYKAQTGSYTLIPLRERYGGARLPQAIVVDMREELKLGNTSPMSLKLLDSLTGVHERGEQAILFLNRRGYNTQISCRSCGEVISCPRCSVSLTYHNSRGGGKMLCHLCGYSAPTPKICPSCSEENLRFLGFGTQKLESELESYLHGMTVMRMDADTTSGKLAYDRLLDDFRRGAADILVGTQMVAKGHDFPRVTLVGVALADTSLYMNDFRAAERTFSLLTQVIGRAGRASENGIAVIQTFAPNNETLRLACQQDYEKFYEGEIAIRRELSYPPFCDMVQLTLTSASEQTVLRAGAELSAALKEKMEGEYSSLPLIAFGPFEAQVYKLNEKYRIRMVIKCRLNKSSRKMFSELLSQFAPRRDVKLAVDLNPLTV